jgi:hypothetical protein
MIHLKVGQFLQGVNEQATPELRAWILYCLGLAWSQNSKSSLHTVKGGVEGGEQIWCGEIPVFRIAE